jgi:hypothetical protein
MSKSNRSDVTVGATSSVPSVILIGLTGAGKSLSLAWIEENYEARRVRRFTTRTPRNDDDPKLVVCVGAIASEVGDFEYEGWGGARYRIAAADVADIRSSGKVPLIELGSPEDALRCKQTFAPAIVVCLSRAAGCAELETLLGSRGMSATDRVMRLGTLVEDRTALEKGAAQYHTMIHNDGTVDDLFRRWAAVLSALGLSEV